MNIASGNVPTEGAEDVDEVLFDDEEVANGSALKTGTDESASASGSGGRTSVEEDGPSAMSSGSTARRGGRSRT